MKKDIKIPKQFWESKKNRPFCECKICTEDLTLPNVEYIIEKSFTKNKITNVWETNFEFAVCTICVQQIIQDYSKETIQNMQLFFSVHPPKKSILALGYQDIEKRISECAFSGQKMTDISEYQISGLCKGNEMIFGDFPLMIGQAAMEEIQMLISEETRKIMNTVKDILIPPVPNRISPDKTPVFI